MIGKRSREMAANLALPCHTTKERRMHLASISILVRDYDGALDYYLNILGFQLIEDTPLDDGKRWLLIAPPGAQETRLLLAKAANPEQLAQVGRQCGGRVFLILSTDDFDRDYHAFTARGVHFHETPRREPYGTVAVFEDLYGNLWDLIEPSSLTRLP
jgi:catechol 2,3-dioxygenase-like lactoylglutathione lyase family enzyme